MRACVPRRTANRISPVKNSYDKRERERERDKTARGCSGTPGSMTGSPAGDQLPGIHGLAFRSETGFPVARAPRAAARIQIDAISLRDVVRFALS